MRISAAALGVVLFLGVADMAQGQGQSYVIDPAASQVTLSGDVTFQFAGDSVMIPFTAPGNGATLPSGAQSDGLTTFFQGAITADVKSDSIRFHLGDSDVDVGVSGSWTPGVPGQEQVAADGNAALDFGEATFGMNGRAVVRDVRFRLSSLDIPLVETGPGTNVFHFDASPLLTVFGGAVDLSTSFPSGNERAVLGGRPVPNMALMGTVERVVGQTVRITLPIELAVMHAPGEVLDTALPIDLSLAASGQIVAPEPSGWASLLVAAATLFGLGRWRLPS